MPKQPVAAAPKKRAAGVNPFLTLSYLILGVSLLAAAGIFGYQYFLTGVAQQKAQAVKAAQNAIDQATVTSFIRLRDRFTAAQQVLSNHVVLSQFFTDLENLTLQGVRFTNLTLTVADDRTAVIALSGTAKSFNTLAAQSQSFATDTRIKRAIFSGITVNGKDNSVSFNVSASLDPSLIRVAPPGAARATGTGTVSTSTASTTP